MAVLASATASPALGHGSGTSSPAKPVEGGLVQRLFINASKHASNLSFDAQSGLFAVRLYRPDRGTWTRIVLDATFPVRRRRVGARVSIAPDATVHIVPTDCDPGRRAAGSGGGIGSGESYPLARRITMKELGCPESALRVDESDARVSVAGGELVGQQVTAAVAACVKRLSDRLNPLKRLAPTSDAAAQFEFAVHKLYAGCLGTSHRSPVDVQVFSTRNCWGCATR